MIDPQHTRTLGLYVLEDRRPVRCFDLHAWSDWMWQHPQERIVAKTEIDPDIEVSTVFLGIDHNFSRYFDPDDTPSAPWVFETMIFGGRHDQFQYRCATWEQAETAHAQACAMASIRSGPTH